MGAAEEPMASPESGEKHPGQLQAQRALQGPTVAPEKSARHKMRHTRSKEGWTEAAIVTKRRHLRQEPSWHQASTWPDPSDGDGGKGRQPGPHVLPRARLGREG